MYNFGLRNNQVIPNPASYSTVKYTTNNLGKAENTCTHFLVTNLAPTVM